MRYIILYFLQKNRIGGGVQSQSGVGCDSSIHSFVIWELGQHSRYPTAVMNSLKMQELNQENQVLQELQKLSLTTSSSITLILFWDMRLSPGMAISIREACFLVYKINPNQLYPVYCGQGCGNYARIILGIMMG